MELLKTKISQEVKPLKEPQEKPKIHNQISSDIENLQTTQKTQTKNRQKNPNQNKKTPNKTQPTNHRTPTNQTWGKKRHAQCIFSSILSIFS